MIRGRSLRHQFFVFAAASMLLLGAVISLAIEAVATQKLQDKFGDNLAELAFHLVDKFDRGMRARASELALIASLGPVREPKDVGEVRAILNHLQSQMPLFSWVGLLDPEGLVIAATGGVLEGVGIEKRPVYYAAKQEPFIGEVHDAKLLAEKLPNPGNEPMRFVDISLPLKDRNGDLLGILASHLSWQWAREIEASLIDQRSADMGVQLFIVSRDNQILLSPDGQGVFDKLELAALDESRKQKRGWTVERWPDGKDYLTGYALEEGYQTYAGLGWTALARQPVDEAFRSIRALQGVIFLIGGIFALGFTIAWWFIARKVAAPLVGLAKAADEISEGRRDTFAYLQSEPMEVRHLSASLSYLVEALTSEERRAENMKRLAHHDRLTGLANRAAFESVLEHLLPEAKRAGEVVACFCLDLDGFKKVNDQFGHAAGDEVLRQVAKRLQAAMRDEDLVVRLGGDEFVAVMTAAPDVWRQLATDRAQRIIQDVNQPIAFEGENLHVGTTVGIACLDFIADEDFASVMKRADAALYRAKLAGKNRAEIDG